MASFNQVTLCGNLTRDVEVKHLQNSTVASFGLAVNERYKDRESVVFLDVKAWNKTAEIAGQYLAKGSPVLVSGRLSMDSWEKDGQRRTKLYLTAERIVFLSSGKREEERDDGHDNGDSPF